MAKLIAIIGNCGSGKTTLANLLGDKLGYRLLLEQHEERPYQRSFMRDHSQMGLQNQIDYLLLRAEQERMLRCDTITGIVDGGLDQDFQIFTRLFHRKGYLSDADFRLCERLYRILRQALSPPDLTIRLAAPLEVLQARLRKRQRPLDIVSPEDLPVIDALFDEWMQNNPLHPRPIEFSSTPEAFSGKLLNALISRLSLLE